MKRVDLAKVRHSRADGRLMASSFDLSMCDQCDGAHIDFQDASGNVFATAIIPPELFIGVAAKLCEFSEFVKKSWGGPDGRQS